jgi:hypothetical protein
MDCRGWQRLNRRGECRLNRRGECRLDRRRYRRHRNRQGWKSNSLTNRRCSRAKTRRASRGDSSSSGNTRHRVPTGHRRRRSFGQEYSTFNKSIGFLCSSWTFLLIRHVQKATLRVPGCSASRRRGRLSLARGRPPPWCNRRRVAVGCQRQINHLTRHGESILVDSSRKETSLSACCWNTMAA